MEVKKWAPMAPTGCSNAIETSPSLVLTEQAHPAITACPLLRLSTVRHVQAEHTSQQASRHSPWPAVMEQEVLTACSRRICAHEARGGRGLGQVVGGIEDVGDAEVVQHVVGAGGHSA